MDPNDIIKVAPELTKAVATLVAGLPIGEVVKRICGPPADLLGEKLKQRVERCFEKTTSMIQDAGFTPQAVPPKLLFLILQGASVEEDEGLHDMWAALLANAASLETTDKVRPGYTAILRQMASDEAILLNWICDHALESSGIVDPTDVPIPVTSLGACLDGLEAAQLIRRSDFQGTVQANGLLGETGPFRSNKSTSFFGADTPASRAAVFADRKDKTYLLTDRGRAFMEACRPPNLNPKA